MSVVKTNVSEATNLLSAYGVYLAERILIIIKILIFKYTQAVRKLLRQVGDTWVRY